MTEARSDYHSGGNADVPNLQAAEPPPTVASLGIQAHLVAVDPERDRQLSDLITACETQRAQWECLCQRILTYLKDEDRRGGDNGRISRLAAL